jgi:uncharacterized protein YegP (UPF0339 family)
MSRDAEYEVRPADNDAGFYYVLVAANNEVLATSETYTRMEDAKRGVEDAKRAAAEADSQG